MKLRYSEAFYSVQGEGRFVGVPSVFLRTFGCNFRCMNFGHSRGSYVRKEGVKYNPEVKQLLDDGVLDKVEKFEDLPIIHTGCDTYASIYPQFKKYMKDHTVDEVVDYILSLTPEGKWTMSNGQDVHFNMQNVGVSYKGATLVRSSFDYDGNRNYETMIGFSSNHISVIGNKDMKMMNLKFCKFL